MHTSTTDLSTVQLDRTQQQLLRTIARPYFQTGRWPTWDYVLHVHEQCYPQDADELLANLPHVGRMWGGTAHYGFTSLVGKKPDPDDTVALTIAAALHLPELQHNFAGPFLRVLHHMAGLQDSVLPDPDEVTQAYLDSRELARAIPTLDQGFIDTRLADILDGEPVTQSPEWGSPPTKQGWRRSITREVRRFRHAKDLSDYVSKTCELVRARNEQRAAHTERARTSRAPAAGFPAQASRPESTPYISQQLIEELKEAGQESRWKVDKLLALLTELNANYAAGHPYSCIALIRAVIDHVPSVFGQKSFKAVISSVTMGRTDKAYLTALESCRLPGDDVMHRQAGTTASRIDMAIVPPASHVRALLDQTITALQTAKTT
ncbi:hypothetical protein [Streptomyces lydicus]|uniref:hypothetical protein n=1 Tax=Streptomyces lydicus TaxID=47763 RepID=UPI0010117F59|nr:hypothetical protein [Streptomyces lydicus]